MVVNLSVTEGNIRDRGCLRIYFREKSYIMSIFIIFSLRYILLALSNQGGWSGRHM